MNSAVPPWAKISSDGIATLDLSLISYPADVIARTAYDFTDRVFIHTDSAPDGQRATVTLVCKRSDTDLGDVIGEFTNALLDHRLRRDIGVETKMIRELIVAQAFVEADLLDQSDADSDVETDPRGIAHRDIMPP
jgi:His-Xaa-Ser system protein HxsD